MKLESITRNNWFEQENFLVQSRGHSHIPPAKVAAGFLNRSTPRKSEWNRRYVGEFAGSTSLEHAPFQSFRSELKIDEQNSHRIHGSFSSFTLDRLEATKLTATGRLGAKGSFNVDLSYGQTLGSLHLVESAFDDASFALLGHVTICQSATGPGTVLSGSHAGNLALLRPVDHPKTITPGIKTATLTSISGEVHSTQLQILATGQKRVATGRLGTASDSNAYEITISSSAERTYLAGVHRKGFLTVRGGADLGDNDCVIAFRGDYMRRDSAGRLMDFGIFDMR